MTGLSPQKDIYIKVALAVPLKALYDYTLPEPGSVEPLPGKRVWVMFGKRRMLGLIMEVANKPGVDIAKIRPAIEILDHEPLLDQEDLAFWRWAAGYYHHAIGEVMENALPAAIRQGKDIRPESFWNWHWLDDDSRPEIRPNAAKQNALADALDEGACIEQLRAIGPQWKKTITQWQDEGRLKAGDRALPANKQKAAAPELNDEQKKAVAAIEMGVFQCSLLEGVTGSGKTEVYIRLIEQTLARGEQVLLLVPEIGLTPQLLERIRSRIESPVLAMHSGLNDTERHEAWYAARQGLAAVVVGTRSAVFVPLKKPGLVIVDEEHDASLKSQEGFRYHARDLAVIRASRLGVPVLLGSATPSLESLHNALVGRYQHLQLSKRAGGAVQPEYRLLDMRASKIDEGLSQALIQACDETLARGEQTLLFLNRRGYAPIIMCSHCGWHADCPRCDAHMTLHRSRHEMRCHHCDYRSKPWDTCPSCALEEPLAMGEGTQKIAEFLESRFKDKVIRIDRDNMQSRDALQKALQPVNDGKAALLVGTQMLAKGHHLPNVTLVAVVNADQSLFSADFRASERLAQLLTQVAGRAGREKQKGRVLVQTWHPEHELLKKIFAHGYGQVARQLLKEREAMEFPPFTHMALLRADATRAGDVMQFLSDVKNALPKNTGVECLGPMPALMERRAGRYRYLLVFQGQERKPLHQVLSVVEQIVERMKSKSRVRWGVDVDPLDF